MLFCFFIFVAIRWPLLAAFVHFIQLPLPVAIPILMFSILFFPRPRFPWPPTMYSSASLATCPKDEKCLGKWRKGSRTRLQVQWRRGCGVCHPVHKHIFPNFSYCFYYIFFLYISTFYLSSWQEPTTRRLLKWNYKEVVVSSGTWKWLNEKPLEQYQSAKCALCALDFPPFCCPSGVGLLIDNIIKN